MKELTIEQFAKDPQGFIVDAVQNEPILVTREGSPFAVVMGLDNKDEEDRTYEASPEFWEMIRERRARPTVPLKNIKEELLRGND